MYECSEGYTTIGYGLNLDAGINQRLATVILEDQVFYLDILLSGRYSWYDGLDTARESVVLNMAFNLGIDGFGKFRKTIALIESGDYILAADEMLDSQWAEQVGDRAIELSEMMRTGQWPNIE